MTENPNDVVRAALRAMQDGRWEDVPDEMLDDVEAFLNEHPDHAVGDALPNDAAFPNDGPTKLEPSLPSEAQWATCLTEIENRLNQTGGDPRIGKTTSALPGGRRSGMIGVAAALLLIVGWQIFGGAETTQAMPLATCDQCIIDSVEVFGDSTTFVVTAGDEESDLAVIWVVEGDSVLPATEESEE